eukprot:1724253-Karenia_brevis.AAC.1
MLAPVVKNDDDDAGDIFRHYPDIPAPGGLRMINRVIKDFGVPGFKGVNIPWYDTVTNGENFAPHPDNMRCQSIVDDDYDDSILQFGVCSSARGKPFALMSDTANGRPYLLITWGTLSRAFYRMARAHRQNPNILESLE